MVFLDVLVYVKKVGIDSVRSDNMHLLLITDIVNVQSHLAGNCKQAYQITDINIWVVKLSFRYNESGAIFFNQMHLQFLQKFITQVQGVFFNSLSPKSLKSIFLELTYQS